VNLALNEKVQAFLQNQPATKYIDFYTAMLGPDQKPNPADVANKYPRNVAGRFYVDDQCIDCDLCRETAPANFTRDDDGGHTYVYKQPENPDEETLCQEAMEGCPVEAIGSDANS
jgi:ferredoxin